MNSQTLVRRYYSTREIAAVVGVHPATVARWAEAGLLTAYRIGGVVRFDLEQVIRQLHGDEAGEVAANE
jgi:excisionase family DNA binding protein